METKRVILATVLCFIILIGWSQLSIFMGWTPDPSLQEVQTTESQAETVAPAPVQTTTPTANFVPQDGREIKIDTPLYTATINSSGAILSSFKLKNYSAALGSNEPVELISNEASLVSPMGILFNGQPTWFNAEWMTEAQDIVLDEGVTSLEFVGQMGDVQFKRILTFAADTYLIKENFSILPTTAISARTSFTVATTTLAGVDNSYDTMKVVYDDGSYEIDDDVKDLTNEGLLQQGTFQWSGLASNYFMAAVAPVTSTPSTLKARIQNGVWRVALEESDEILPANVETMSETYWWFGPKDRELLTLAPQNLQSSTDLGFFDILARPMLWLMNFLYSFVHNWGVAIIVLTILIKLAFWPLTKKSFTSMEKMKRLQPMIQDIQKKYANDREALSRETMQLYKTYGVNPLGGCLPILVQIPVFFALYQVLLQALALRHSSFVTYLPFTDILWLADLSAKDPLYITPLLMGGTMFLQQYLTPAMGDPTQRKMMLFMPVIFTFLFLNFPSGLVLYWLMSNVFSIAQQWFTLRKIKN